MTIRWPDSISKRTPSPTESATRPQVALALDVADFNSALQWVETTRDVVDVFKVGLELFSAVGPAIVERIVQSGSPCFLDLKLHDIPKTMERATRVAVDVGVSVMTVHAAAGPRAIEAVARIAARSDTRVVAVTALTSLRADDLRALGLKSASVVAERYARVAMNSGAAGIVCSAHECDAFKRAHPTGFAVVPGIRPAGTAAADQARVATPRFAADQGADLLVVGRPIRQATDPRAAALAIRHALEVQVGKPT